MKIVNSTVGSQKSTSGSIVSKGTTKNNNSKKERYEAVYPKDGVAHAMFFHRKC